MKTNNVLYFSVDYKKCDIKNTFSVVTEQNKIQRIFAFLQKTVFCFVGLLGWVLFIVMDGILRSDFLTLLLGFACIFLLLMDIYVLQKLVLFLNLFHLLKGW